MLTNDAATAPSAVPRLACQDLSKSYGSVRALQGFSLGVHAGEFVALLGPNGAGKSTLMQLLTGLFTPDAGSVQILGHSLQKAPSLALAHIGVVFQQLALDMDLSVYQNLLFHCRMHGIGSKLAAERIAAELEQMGIADIAQKTCRELSGGTKRKVELARALLHRPALLLMDEASVGLDLASRKELLSYVHQLCRERGMATLWTTHLVQEVVDADRIAMLIKGQKRFEGSAAELCQAAQKEHLEDAVLHLQAQVYN